MTIAPKRLKRVGPDAHDSTQLKRGGLERGSRSLVKVAHDIPFTLAPGTRTAATQLLEWDEGLLSIVPFDGEFLADVLDVDWLHVVGRHG